MSCDSACAENEAAAIMRKSILPVLKQVDDPDIKNRIRQFWNDTIVPYFLTLESIDRAIKNGEIDPPEASVQVTRATDAALATGDQLEEELNDPELIRKVKDAFRMTGAPYGLQSDFVRHAFEKPGGYPGDYETLEFIYNNTPTSKGFGYCADETFLANDYARAVRNRKDKMKQILKDYLSGDPQNAQILNVACGASRDLRELFAENTFTLSGKVTFTLIDKSREALDFSLQKLEDRPNGVDMKGFNHSVYDYLKDPETHRDLLGPMDMVYSIGLADYIPADGFRDLIGFFYSLLKPGGRLVIAHKDSKNYHPLTPDWWADWSFYLRDIEDVVNLAKSSGIDNYELSIEQEDDTNIIFFLIIQKK
ncbi:hypothetical protein JCM14469_15480 [Desulfatiferula olefinivorans]